MQADKPKFRAVFISDIHLGTPGCRADALLAFLRSNTFETLYLVGDIVDFWALSRRSYFPQDHVNVMRKFLARAARDVRVVYLPGNHDEVLRKFLPLSLGNIEVVDEIIHETVDGKRMLVLHGDKFDQIVQHARWLAFMGDVGYHVLLGANKWVNAFRRQFGYGYWSLSAAVKRRVKVAVNFIGGYEAALARAANEKGADGVICGHIHHAEIKTIDGVLYCNSGDWVESCTALVEHMDGRLEILHRP